MSALLSGGALMMIRVPSSETSVTPIPGVRPKLPFTVEHFPVNAGLFLQMISAAIAAGDIRQSGPKKSSKLTACLITAHFLQGLSRRFGQEQDRDQGNGNCRQHPLDGGAVSLEFVV